MIAPTRTELPVAAFLTDLARTASPATVAAYRQDLGTLPPTDLTRPSVLAWLARRTERGDSPATVSRRLAACRRFCRWLVDHDRLASDPTAAVAYPPRPPAVSRVLSPAQVAALVDAPAAAHGSARGLHRTLLLRDHALLALLASTGMRSSEVLGLDAEGTACGRVDLPGRVLDLDEATRAACGIYLGRARPLLVRGGEPALFMNGHGGRLTRQGLWLILRTHAREAGLGGDVPPSDLRHARAVALIRAGTPVAEVARLLGHAGVTTVYGLYGEHIREARVRIVGSA